MTPEKNTLVGGADPRMGLDGHNTLSVLVACGVLQVDEHESERERESEIKSEQIYPSNAGSPNPSTLQFHQTTNEQEEIGEKEKEEKMILPKDDAAPTALQRTSPRPALSAPGAYRCRPDTTTTDTEADAEQSQELSVGTGELTLNQLSLPLIFLLHLHTLRLLAAMLWPTWCLMTSTEKTTT